MAALRQVSSASPVASAVVILTVWVSTVKLRWAEGLAAASQA